MVKQIRRVMAEFCPFCQQEMDSSAHMNFCPEANALQIKGIEIHAMFYRDRDGDLWATMYNVSTGETDLIPMADTDNPVIAHLEHSLNWLYAELRNGN
ncbi:MAG: hypothetical protein A2W25_11645 [candidate division Zixibacteria bacterium RBG_16_53_22]|nr:MAG: hypothetical protein A2W25_11645 [candidate division Zixibacteria bacterium RBG_16_53_22]